MEQTVNQKTYNTETAKPLGNWQRGYSSEKGYISETLYMNDTGDYFLHGEGGPRSRYAQRVGMNTWGYGERIIPMSDEEAHAWAENHLTESTLHHVFVQTAYDGCLTPMMIHLKCTTAERLQKLADEQGRDVSALAEELIFKALEQG